MSACDYSNDPRTEVLARALRPHLAEVWDSEDYAATREDDFIEAARLLAALDAATDQTAP